MLNRNSMCTARHLAAAFALLALARPAFTTSAQTTQPKPELLLFHPSGPPLSYEVATIKPIDPNAADRMVKLPPGVSLSPLSIRRYIMNAYGAFYAAQVVGGPDWLSKDSYNIKGKAPDDIEAAQQTMKSDDRLSQTRAMQQSLLVDRFHLKAHFETRILPVYELVPAKGGLKLTAVPAPPGRHPGDPLPPPPPPPQPGESPPPLPPGTLMTMFNSNTGLRTVRGSAIKMDSLARTVGFSGATEIEDRPIVDHTGFTHYFDITDLTWAPLSAAADSTPDAPSLVGALEKTLGIRLVPAKDPIEVLVIDSIDRPSQN
jgi:uncharacterized protein (TIGR03435 family)